MRWIAAFGLPIGLIGLVVALVVFIPEPDPSWRDPSTGRSMGTPASLEPAELPPRQWVKLKNRYGRAEIVQDPELVQRVEDAAIASGARAIDVTVMDFGPSKLRVPVTTLQSHDHDQYMRVGLRDFLRSYPNRSRAWLVQLVAENGGHVWIGGGGSGPKKGTRWRLRGFWDLRGCSPVASKRKTLWTEPPPPALHGGRLGQADRKRIHRIRGVAPRREDEQRTASPGPHSADAVTVCQIPPPTCISTSPSPRSTSVPGDVYL